MAALLVAAALAVSGGHAIAAEGAASHYLPGTAGDIVIAQLPEPGWQAAYALWVQSGTIGTTPLQGRLNLDLKADSVLNWFAFSYTFPSPVFGLTYSVGGLLPVASVELEASLTGPLGNTFRVEDSAFGLTDAALVPLQLNWRRGDFHVQFAEVITAPTGPYDVDNIINPGRNYWSFDTVAAVTWFREQWGTEVSVAPGIMLNTTNEATDYLTGAEFHVDFTANQFLSETFALGLRGYYYQQITGDSGSGAILGEFKSGSLGLGAGFLWVPKFGQGKFSILGKWMRDVYAENRLESDYGTLLLAWTF